MLVSLPLGGTASFLSVEQRLVGGFFSEERRIWILQSRFKSEFPQILAVEPWARPFTLPRLSFLIYKTTVTLLCPLATFYE